MNFNNRDFRRGGSSGNQGGHQPSLPDGYLRKGYFDEKGNVLPEIVIQWPKDIARKLEQAFPKLNSTQLRKFFTEARHIEGQLKAGKSFDSLKVRILKLDNYAQESVDKKKAPPLFKQFIEQNLKWAVNDQKSYIEGFVNHFESVVAYFPKKQ